MKIVDCAPSTDKVKSSSALGSVVERLRLGEEWQKDMQSQEGVLLALGQVLDNQYTLLRNVKLEGLDVPIPMILLGPTGIRVLYPSATRGVFRAKSEVWEKLDERVQIYRPVKPNPIARVALMAKAVNSFLAARGHALPQFEPVLIFPNPGTHVEQVRPLVRIVLVDAMERFANSLLQGRPVLDQDQIQEIIVLLNTCLEGSAAPEEQLRRADAFSFVDERGSPSSKEPPAIVDVTDKQMRKLSSKLPFSTKQLVILITLIVVNILILIAVAIFVLVNL